VAKLALVSHAEQVPGADKKNPATATVAPS